VRRVKLIKSPKYEAKAFVPPKEDIDNSIRKLQKELEFYRHKCSDEWLEELIKELKVENKKITPNRVRQILVGATRKRLEQ